MILDLLIGENKEISVDFARQFSKINRVKVNPKLGAGAQVSQIEDELGKPSIQKMLVYSREYSALGTVLSRRYINAAKISKGPLKLADTNLLPDHISSLPNRNKRNRILFLAPHFDEAYLAAILPHKLIGDEIFLHTFTFSKKEKERTKQAYGIMGLAKDEYSLGTLKVNSLFREKKTIEATVQMLINQFNPTVVFSVFPKGASFDHMALAQATRKVVINQSEADLIYGYVIQSRNTNPTIFPILSESINKKILQAFGDPGFGEIFQKYLPYLEHYMRTLSEPLFRVTSDPNWGNIYSLPLEAERITNYRIPNLLQPSTRPDTQTIP